MHWCADETALALSVIGYVSAVVTWLRVSIARLFRALARAHR